jgi:hypothetical protein
MRKIKIENIPLPQGKDKNHHLHEVYRVRGTTFHQLPEEKGVMGV